MAKWQGYQRFCSLARALDVLGDRWTLLIIQELSFKPRRYNELKRKLVGIGNNVLVERLERLVKVNILTKTVENKQIVTYALGPRGEALLPALAELRRWGTDEQLQLTDHAPEQMINDMSYDSYHTEKKETYQWVIGDKWLVLEFEEGVLTQKIGKTSEAALVVRTDRDFMRELMAGTVTWADGRLLGRVEIEGEESAWQRMLLATAYPRIASD